MYVNSWYNAHIVDSMSLCARVDGEKTLHPHMQLKTIIVRLSHGGLCTNSFYARQSGNSMFLSPRALKAISHPR